MVIKREPTLRSQWLGQQLRELREAAKLRLSDVAEYMLHNQGTISRYESGILPPKPAEVLALVNLYGVDDLTQRDALDRLSRETWRKGWWDGYAGQVAHDFIDYAWLEDRATSIRSFDTLTLPGLVQTRGFAEAVIRASDPDEDEERINGWLQFRMDRQQLLQRADAPQISLVVDEGLVRRSIGGCDAMAEQLYQLNELGSTMNFEIHVLPHSAGAHAAHDGAFQIFELPEPYPEVAYAETLAGSIYVESEKVSRFARAYDRLQQSALPPDESAALIAAAAKELT